MTYDPTAYAIREAQRKAAATVLQRKYPMLVKADGNALVAAAKNIRWELARYFRGVKFKVTSSRFSMGDSISVSWTDGPTSAQVDSIVNKYAAGSFDGMTDSYTYAHCAWTDAFGDAKYVHTERSYSDRFIQSVLTRVSRMWGVDPAPSVEDYRQGRIWNFRVPNCGDFDREVHAGMSRQTCNPTHIAIDDPAWTPPGIENETEAA